MHTRRFNCDLSRESNFHTCKSKHIITPLRGIREIFISHFPYTYTYIYILYNNSRFNINVCEIDVLYINRHRDFFFCFRVGIIKNAV